MNDLVVFFTLKSKMTPDSGPFGPFENTGAAFAFTEAHFKVLKAERGAQVDGFFTVPATSYGFDKEGKAVLRPSKT